jgi:hypothetical protein
MRLTHEVKNPGLMYSGGQCQIRHSLPRYASMRAVGLMEAQGPERKRFKGVEGKVSSLCFSCPSGGAPCHYM